MQMRFTPIFFGIFIVLMLSYENSGAWANEKLETDGDVNRDLNNLITTIKSILVNADDDMQLQAWHKANILLKKGLTDLGGRYLSKNIIDDTGARLIIAKGHENRGELENAAKIRHSILNSRLNLLRDKLHSITTN